MSEAEPQAERTTPESLQNIEPFVGDEHQRVLLQELERIDGRSDGQPRRLSVMYRGALEALKYGNVDRHALAAHNLRELINHMPHAVLDEVKSLDERMGDKVGALSDQWVLTLRSRCYDGGQWGGEIDNRLRRFLGRAGEFFGWVAGNREARASETAEALRRLDASGRRIPLPLARRNAEYWQEMADFFVGVCHHGRPTNDDEFTEWLSSLEHFLLERLHPRTFERVSELDRLIAEGEVNA
jgi:hypothetical protein